MRSSSWLSCGVLVVLAASWVVVGRSPAQAPQGLPGARPIIDARQFPSLQAALDAVPAGGGLVQFPAGVFEISEPLVIRREDVTVEGTGGATHIKNLNANGQPAILIAAPDSAKTDKTPKPSLWRVRLANFRVTGNPQSGPGIQARWVNEIFLQGLTVSYHGGDGIQLDECYEDPRISDSLITYNQATGLNLLGCHDIVVCGNQFEENRDAVHCMDGFNLCMTGNCVDDHLGAGVVIENTYGSVVSGNMIEECQGTAIVLDRDCYGIALSANVIAHNGAGIDLRDAHGCSVSANTFTLMKTDALRIRAASGRIAVAGNSFCNSFIGDGQVKRGTDDLAAAGVVLESTRDVGITGNVFSDLTTPAVVVPEGGVPHSLFRDNVLVGGTSEHARIMNPPGDNQTEPQK